ncbi:outer membrane protein assembly factor BamE [Spiribacter halobius]|uniref:outer membrane protein assembly factor BamE n=1 Tax=Sediminicurvatus halobius TaxID=2182432 RepID=UPI001304D11D|nr:outer membrane protein assembly factor BamE [Spiribacter halobius]UEX79423.1 outer membrane protein assembly factor BamE [Spiribacter halobius]
MVDSLPIVYKPHIRQGTVITEEAVTQLERGMSPRQVRFLLGSPTLQHPFADERWDYVQRVVPRSDDELEPVSRRLTLYFEDEALVGARGDFVAADSPLRAGIPADG